MGSSATHFAPSLTMLVPKQHRHDVYKYLFKEGVMVAKKDFNKKKHDDPELNVPNLHVIKLMQSLKSRGFVNEGFDYLQKFLNLPADVVPATLKKSNRPASRPSEGGKGGKGGYRGDDGYRRGGFGDKAGPGGDFRPSYGGGRGGGF